MLKNVGSQTIGAQVVSATDGSAFTGTVTVYVTGDGGTQGLGATGSGVCTHEGNGYHSYVPSQAETNYSLVAFTFTGSGAVPVTVQVYTLPTTGVLAPFVAGRTLKVSAAGYGSINWGDLEGKTTSNVLAGTSILSANSITNEKLQIFAGTLGATGNDTTHLHLAGISAYADDALKDLLVRVYDVSGSLYYSAWIDDWVSSTELATVETLPFTPQASTDTYIVFAIRRGLTQAETLAALGDGSAFTEAGGTGDHLTAIPQLATALTEAYRSTGATGTLAQLLYEILAHLGEHTISGTTKTTKKLDGSTTAKTYTLDDDTNPTSITETT